MRSRIALIIAALAFVLVSCGGGDDGGGFQEKVADQLISSFQEAQIDIDSDCAHDAAKQLSDADAKIIFEAGPGGDAEGLSDSAESAVTAIAECIEY